MREVMRNLVGAVVFGGSGLLLLLAAAPAAAQDCSWVTFCYVSPTISWCCSGCWVCI